MSKIAALQFPTLALSESRLDYYLKASKDNGVNLVVLGEYVINSFFTELLHMPKNMIKEQSEAKKESLIKLAKKYELEIIAPYVSVEAKSYKKLCFLVLRHILIFFGNRLWRKKLIWLLFLVLVPLKANKDGKNF